MTEPILSELLQEEGYSVFEIFVDDALRPVGLLPGWFLEVFGVVAGNGSVSQLAEKSPFLENFLVDAAKVWNSAAGERIHSGAWIERGEQGREFALEASALRIAEKKILVIANSARHYAQRVETLQTARDFTLQHERLQKEIIKKEILLHCIVHDLSQPLTAIRGCLSLAGMEGLPQSVRSVLEIAERQSRRQEEMIREILTAFSGELALQQAGEAANGPDLVKIAQEVSRDFAPAFMERGARIAVDPAIGANREWRVYGDAARLRRIYTNLVENALRYSPSGSTVTLGVAEDGHFLRASVDDQGPGLPQGEAAPKLFALFGRGKQGGGKAGLGLYFCKMTVERWGGEIGAERRPEGGTRFWFRLPRWVGAKTPQRAAPVATAQDQQAPVAPRATPSKPKGKPARPLRILLADDLEVNLELTTAFLEKKGHTVVAVRNGREAVAAFGRDSFDVALLDVEMPEMDGREAARAIRKMEKPGAKRARIVALTAHAGEAHTKDLLEAGMDAHLTKPFEPEALWEVLEHSISSSDAGTRGQTPAPASPPASAKEFEAALLKRVGGNRRLLATLIRLFRQEYPAKLRETRKAVAQLDAPALARSAHALKGLAGNFGENSALAAARALEAMGWNGDLSAAAPAIATLEKEIRSLEETLASFTRTSAKAPRRKK